MTNWQDHSFYIGPSIYPGCPGWAKPTHSTQWPCQLQPLFTNPSLSCVNHHSYIKPHSSPTHPPQSHLNLLLNLSSLLFSFSMGFLLLPQANLSLYNLYLSPSVFLSESINASLSCIFRHFYSSRCLLILAQKGAYNSALFKLRSSCMHSFHKH